MFYFVNAGVHGTSMGGQKAKEFRVEKHKFHKKKMVAEEQQY